MSLSIYNITTNSATLRITNMRYWEKGYNYFEITGDISKIWYPIGNQEYETTTNLTGLNPGQTYNIYVFGFYSGGQEYFGNISFTTKGDPRPTNWEWNTIERNAFNNKGAVTDVKWYRWNSFIDKIIEFRNYKGKPTYVTVNGTSYYITNAKVSSSNRILTALKFNIANQAITEMNSTSLNMRSPGDEVYGLMFLIFENKLNGIT